MNCENGFCIYQSDGNCTHQKIRLDRSGMCMDCIYPDIDEEILEQAKFKLLTQYQECEKSFPR